MNREKLSISLAKRLREVFTDGKWVTGTNFKAEILNLDWEVATAKISDLNSIADLTFHINYYVIGITKVIEGGTLDIKDKYSFDSIPIKSSQDWKSLVTQFSNDSEKLVSLIEKMSDDKLFKDFADKKYGNYYRNIEVMIEHTYYHLGQILLIKKLLNNRN